jgi:cell division protein FtsQ
MTRAVNADTEVYPQEVLADEEPRYLRRQKPLAVRRRKFGRSGWLTYRRWVAAGALVVTGGWLIYAGAQFFLYSPRVEFSGYEQLEITGNHYVSTDSVSELFASDLGRSVLRIPLAERRSSLEAIPWVERATVERMLPNRVRVSLTERTPVAFLRLGHELALTDAYGTILEKPIEGDFAFPVVSGISDELASEERAKRIRLMMQFLRDVDLAQPGASRNISELDLSDERDVRAMIAGLAGFEQRPPLLVRFGDGDFVNKYLLLIQNLGNWQMSAGRVESVDLRFSRQVVVNPGTETTAAAAGTQKRTARASATRKAAR